MKNERDFDNILDECIGRVMHGEDITSCLARYPEQAAELEPLLKTVFDTKQAADIRPRPEFRQRAAYEFQAAIRSMPVKGHSGFRWQLRWVMPVAIIVVVLTAGSGTVLAANNSLPDEPLYKVKLATEAVRIALTPSDMGKAELYAKFADKRVDEIVELADNGQAKQIDTATDRMNSQLIAMSNLTGNNAAAGGGASPAMLQAPAPETYEAADTQADQAAVALTQPPILVPAQVPTPEHVPGEIPAQTTGSAGVNPPPETETAVATAPPAVLTVPPSPETETTVVTTPPVMVTEPPPAENTTVISEPEPQPTQEPELATATPPEHNTKVVTPPTTFSPLAASRQKTPVLATSNNSFTLDKSESDGSKKTFNNDKKFIRQQKLKRILSDKIRQHLEKLQEQLEKAPDDLKPSIQRAIEVIINGYESNLSNLK